MPDLSALPAECVGLRLCRMSGERLLLCEPVIFTSGRHGVHTVLRRAAISGKVGPFGETGDHWADLLTNPHNWIDTVALDAASYRALKTRWMRCKLETVDG